MVQNVVKEVVEEKTAESVISPTGEVEKVAEQLENLVETAKAVSLTYDWSPLKDSGQAGRAEAFIEEICETIPELVPSRSKGQNICLKFNGKKPVARFWFSQSKIAVNTLKMNENGRGGHEPKSQSRFMPEKGFPAKVRKTIIAEICRYIKYRGFSVPAPEAEG